MNDRIKLAEAMGWVPHNQDVYPGKWIDPDGRKLVGCFNMPDPFEDANDDYAVLRWMRGDGKPEFQAGWGDFCEELQPFEYTDYQIGDYARAALKVLE